jgi:hypothetical protein
MRGYQFALLTVLTLVLVLAAQPLVAATYYVGACKNGAFFTTIKGAVAAAPAGSVINVCPGTYAEQLVISKALTLQGILNNDSSQAVITVPSAGLTTTSSIYVVTVAAQVEVTTGPVNITNITVDGTAGTNCPSSSYAGIYYGSGSSGTVNGVETRNQNCNSFGIGMLAENGASATAQSVIIKNSNIHDNSDVGILTCSDQTPSTLTATITGNYVAGSDYGIVAVCNAAGNVSANLSTAAFAGVYVISPFTTVSGNTVTGSTYGVITNTATVTSNHISNSPTGIYLFSGTSGATVKSNTIAKASTGIEFNCSTGTITGNTINGAAKGIDSVPATFNLVNKFYKCGNG